jgi:AAA+ superfamily predicted ATPase
LRHGVEVAAEVVAVGAMGGTEAVVPFDCQRNSDGFKVRIALNVHAFDPATRDRFETEILATFPELSKIAIC